MTGPIRNPAKNSFHQVQALAVRAGDGNKSPMQANDTASFVFKSVDDTMTFEKTDLVLRTARTYDTLAAVSWLAASLGVSAVLNVHWENSQLKCGTTPVLSDGCISQIIVMAFTFEQGFYLLFIS